MKRNILVFLSLLCFHFLSAQTNKLRIELKPSVSMSLYSSKSLDSYPSRTTEYSPTFIGSFTINYLKRLKNQDYIKLGIGIFSTGHKAIYSENPPIHFSKRTDILKAHYVQVPIEYVIAFGKFEMDLGVSGNVLLSEKRIVGTGDNEKYLYDIPFDGLAFGAGAGLDYTFNISNQLGLILGFFSHYLLTENQMNYGVNIGIEYKHKK
ncbi:MAG: hypothetical protein K9G67_05730 [Bacteroidales bacterium]|nr:hypothetical protein [Bacteroidales bacterium]MCF8344731.1 hypothetical protein [Bacteroidales bacterium]MCF8350220.1 hypothetical protein [Bacteroidales bacterium]MCF8375835.1 hypothetical protein [Bacteroidales bacterium]MCF8402270.1 hypothetical protein [Bacteroidales bacterium]